MELVRASLRDGEFEKPANSSTSARKNWENSVFEESFVLFELLISFYTVLWFYLYLFYKIIYSLKNSLILRQKT